MTTYDRPIVATLYVHLDNGETFEAQATDLEKFDLVKRHDAYWEFDQKLIQILHGAGLLPTGDITDTHLNIVRYLAENVIVYPDLVDHPDHVADWAKVAEIEKRLGEFEALHDFVARLADMWDSSDNTREFITERYGPLGRLIDEAKGVIEP